MKRSQNIFKKIGKYLDPFLVLGIFVLFTIPIITLISLTPGHSTPSQNENVLGLTDLNSVSVTANTTAADGIVVEKMTQNSESSYTIYIQSYPHNKGVYRNSILTATNGTEDEKKIHVTSNFEGVALGTKVSIVVDDVRFIVLDTDGTTYPPTLYVVPSKSMTVDLEITSPSEVNYTTGFSLDLAIE